MTRMSRQENTRGNTRGIAKHTSHLPDPCCNQPRKTRWTSITRGAAFAANSQRRRHACTCVQSWLRTNCRRWKTPPCRLPGAIRAGRTVVPVRANLQKRRRLPGDALLYDPRHLQLL